MCGILISVLANVFSRLAFGEEILFHRPGDARESQNISIQELFWSIFEVLNAIFCIFVRALSRIFEVIEVVVASVPTNGSSVACYVVIWLSFLSIKFSSQRSTFSG